MKNWILAGVVVAVLGFFVAESPAQESLKAPGTTITKTTEFQSGPVVRTGLFRRLGDRRGMTSSNFVPSTTVVPSTTTKVEPLPPTTTTVVPSTGGTIIEPRTGLFGRLRGRMVR